MQNKESIATRVRPLLTPVVEEMQLLLWDVKYVKEGSLWFLRILIDKEGGIDSDTCADFSRSVSKIIDEVDPIEGAYYLEISSAGIERDITAKEHFEWAIGKPISVKVYVPIDGKKLLVGVLQEKQDNLIIIQTEDGIVEIPIDKTAYIRLWDEKISGGITNE